MLRSLEILIDNLSSLPGIGRKSASRLAYFILSKDKNYAHELADSMIRMVESVRKCKICNSLTEDEVCDICTNPKKATGQLCVVERYKDLLAIEASESFFGRYHILGGVLSPLDGIMPQDLAIDSLKQRIEPESIKDIIIATNPTTEGNITSDYLYNELKEFDVNVYRLAIGMPSGSDLDYLDKMTIFNAMKLKQKIQYN